MDDIIEDLFKIYLANIDSYNSKIHQTINDKYTIIDKAMIVTYLFVKIIEDRNEKNQDVTEVLSNYLLKQSIYSETGNLEFEIADKSKIKLYHDILNKLVLEKFEYKNRLMKKLKYNYKNIELNRYSELLVFLEDIAEFAIFQKMILRGNQECVSIFEITKNKIINQVIECDDYFYEEKKEIVSLIIDGKFNESQYGNLVYVVLNLKDVYRYSQITTQLPDSVLFHQYMVATMSLLIAEYSNRELGENIDVYDILVKSLFHDFGEYKGTEIITQFKNYNDITIKMFAEIEENDEKELEEKIGTNLYNIIVNFTRGAEGYIVEAIDKLTSIMKLWVEVRYFHNYTFVKTVNSIYQDRFKRFLKINNVDGIKNKSFYLDFIREYYVYIKERLLEFDIDCSLMYFTEKEIEEFRAEIKLLKSKPEAFLK